jgi:hypothetical protein
MEIRRVGAARTLPSRRPAYRSSASRGTDAGTDGCTGTIDPLST